MLEKILGLLYYNVELQEDMLEAVKTDLMTGDADSDWHLRIFKSTSIEKYTKMSFRWKICSERQRCGSLWQKPARSSKFPRAGRALLTARKAGETIITSKEDAKATLELALLLQHLI